MLKKESENEHEESMSGNGIVTKWDRAVGHPHPGAENAGGQKGRLTGGDPRETGRLEGQGQETGAENVTGMQETEEGQVQKSIIAFKILSIFTVQLQQTFLKTVLCLLVELIFGRLHCLHWHIISKDSVEPGYYQGLNQRCLCPSLPLTFDIDPVLFLIFKQTKRQKMMNLLQSCWMICFVRQSPRPAFTGFR